ncbi:MAG: hypothetical protein MJD61_15360 [Proteobacteria bacterium]|nr:hypothetical protein [Pseudomonadota bacterium]
MKAFRRTVRCACMAPLPCLAALAPGPPAAHAQAAHVPNAQAPAVQTSTAQARSPKARAKQGAASPQALSGSGRATIYRKLVRKALGLALEGDYKTALRALDEAVQRDPGNPEAFYFAAELQRLRGDHMSAYRSYGTVARLGAAQADLELQARGLYGRALVLEHWPARWVEALSAWNAYLRFAADNQVRMHAAAARERARAITLALQRRRAAAGVRQRILDPPGLPVPRKGGEQAPDSASSGQ